MGLTTATFFLIDVLLERPGLEQIVGLIEQTELTPDFLNTASDAMLLETRGALRVQRRDHERGIADLRAAGEISRALRFGPSYSTWRCTLEEGPPGLDRLRDSVALLERSPARVERARSLVALGSALRRANRRADAREPLVAGLAAAAESGAIRLAERAQRELEAAGGRRPRTIASGVEALTASERRIATLASESASNIAIAQELYISLKTVETHLTRAYGKLGLSGAGSRERLPALMARDG